MIENLHKEVIYVRIINPVIYVPKINAKQMLKNIERYGRVCYKSEDKITESSYVDFLLDKVKRGHLSLFEHEKVTVKIICDRGISHELVRHRIASYSQESTRYCNYSRSKFDGELTFILPFMYLENQTLYDSWYRTCKMIEEEYLFQIENGATPQEARSILPNSLKTEIVVTMNLREWMHFFSLRAQPPAHPQMKQIAIPLLLYFRDIFYPIMSHIGYDVEFANKYDKYFAIIEEEGTYEI